MEKRTEICNSCTACGGLMSDRCERCDDQFSALELPSGLSMESIQADSPAAVRALVLIQIERLRDELLGYLRDDLGDVLP